MPMFIILAITSFAPYSMPFSLHPLYIPMVVTYIKNSPNAAYIIVGNIAIHVLPFMINQFAKMRLVSKMEHILSAKGTMNKPYTISQNQLSVYGKTIIFWNIQYSNRLMSVAIIGAAINLNAFVKVSFIYFLFVGELNFVIVISNPYNIPLDKRAQSAFSVASLTPVLYMVVSLSLFLCLHFLNWLA